VFRALCKLSMKNAPLEGTIDPFAVRGKIVSLELLKICLENSGPTFRAHSDRCAYPLLLPSSRRLTSQLCQDSWVQSRERGPVAI